MEISPTTLALFTLGGTLLGVIVPSIFNLLTAHFAQKSEERRQAKELVVTAALENWKQLIEVRSKSGVGGMQAPLDVFLIHMARAADIIFDPTTNADNYEERMKRVDEVTAVAIRRADRLTEEARNRQTNLTPSR